MATESGHVGHRATVTEEPTINVGSAPASIMYSTIR